MKYLLLLVTIVFCSCSPKIRTSVAEKHEKLNETDKVVVFNAKSELPQAYSKIGTTKIGDTGFTTNCDLMTVLEKAKIEARKSGANALLITEHLYPSTFGSTCHRITADLLRIENTADYDKPKIVKDTLQPIVSSKAVSTNEVVYGPVYSGFKTSKFLITANVGQSFRVASSPDGLTSEQKDYYRKLKSGLSYDLSAYYLKEGKGGFGLKYNVYKSSGTIYNQTITNENGLKMEGDFSDDITISFIGPSFILTEDQNARVGEANLELAIGYMGYQNKSGVAGYPVKITGSNLGMIGGMGYHFRITPHFLLGPQVSFIGGTLKKLKYTYADGTTYTEKLDKEELENLWRIDLAIGAKFRF
ncbi:hypothetical protein RB619_14530 [Flavobacterium sp. LHD-80]|uniref:hypothetical protein n=1 Tax=Flavobacterium sp. LHD-80 TaxID=3071411 RepID=UPI0027E17895|nr:hypothetical protein [Flavobacterium sp. LHD-80]MDQ6471869.1 hypothetical protein [Flavobacterium sp. LHD-80]